MLVINKTSFTLEGFYAPNIGTTIGRKTYSASGFLRLGEMLCRLRIIPAFLCSACQIV